MVRYWFAVFVLGLSASAWSQTTLPAALPATRPTTSPAPLPTTGPAASLPGDASTPKGALRMLFNATDAGDADKVRSLLYSATPVEDHMAQTMAQMSSAVAELHKAIKDMFGEEQTKATFGDPAVASKMRDELLMKAPETIDGDSAVIQLDSMGKFAPVEFKRVNGTWKLRVGKSLENVDAAQVEMQLAELAIQIKVLRDIATDVQAGKQKNVADVKQTLEARTRQAMMQYVQDQIKAASTRPTSAPTTQPK